MSVIAPHGLALVVRKNQRTAAVIERIKSRQRQPDMQVELRFICEDEHLFAVPVTARNDQLMFWVAAELQVEGAVRGVDHAILSVDGSLDPLPGWLTPGLTPTGNPPALEARMNPDVYEMWQQTRLPMFELKPGA
jgi:hypothetical protein